LGALGERERLKSSTKIKRNERKKLREKGKAGPTFE